MGFVVHVCFCTRVGPLLLFLGREEFSVLVQRVCKYIHTLFYNLPTQDVQRSVPTVSHASGPCHSLRPEGRKMRLCFSRSYLCRFLRKSPQDRGSGDAARLTDTGAGRRHATSAKPNLLCPRSSNPTRYPSWARLCCL